MPDHPPPTYSRDFPESPELAALFGEIWSLQGRSNLHSRFGRFVSALKIPFPGNGDFGSTRRGSNA